MDGKPICDFCSAADPTRTYMTDEIRLEAYIESGRKLSPDMVFAPEWESCDTCGDLVDAGEWEALKKRVLDIFSKKYSLRLGGESYRSYEIMVTTLYSALAARTMRRTR